MENIQIKMPPDFLLFRISLIFFKEKNANLVFKFKVSAKKNPLKMSHLTENVTIEMSLEIIENESVFQKCLYETFSEGHSK